MSAERYAIFVERITAEHGEALRSLLTRMLRDKEAARAVEQDVYRVLYELEERHASVLTRVVVIDLALDRVLKWVANPAAVSDESVRTDDYFKALAARGAAFEATKEKLPEVVRRLPKELREVAIARWIKRRSIQKIAQDLRVSPATIERRLADALMRCRVALVRADEPS